MRRQPVVIALWALASLLGLVWGLYLLVFPVAMQGTTTITTTGETIETTRATYEPLLALIVITILLTIYALLGLALYARHYAAFAIIAAVHIVLSILSAASVGLWLQPSSVVLLVAIIASMILRDQPTSGNSYP